MLVLGFDTATAMSTAAVGDNAGIRAADSALVGTGHGEFTAAQVARVLALAEVTPAELDLIAVGVGPGPYTSTRLGVMLARSLGLAVGIPVIGICTLDVIAVQALTGSCGATGSRGVTGVAVNDSDLSLPQPKLGAYSGFGVATDARRREIYWAVYGADGRRCIGPRVSKPGEIFRGPPRLQLEVGGQELGPGGQELVQELGAGLDHCLAAHSAEQELPRLWAGHGLDRFPELVASERLSVVEPGYPAAEALIELAREAALADRSAGGGSRIGLPYELDDHSGDGSGVSVPFGVALPARPLYLRRPDAHPPRQLAIQVDERP